MKRYVLAVVAAIIVTGISGVPSSFAQIEVVVGTPNVGVWYYPFMPYYPANRFQYILLASEIQAAGGFGGLIRKIAFQHASPAWYNGTTAREVQSFTIRMQHTTLTNLSGGFVNTGFTTVYGPTNYQATVNTTPGSWLEFPDFTTPFVWDGSSNLLIDICHQNADLTQAGGAYPNLWGFLGSGTNRASWSYDFWGWAGCGSGSSICQGQCGWNFSSYCPVTKLWIAVGIEQSFPDDVDPRRILVTTSNYDGSSSQFPKPSITFRRIPNHPSFFTYVIRGPLPSQNIVYRGLNSSNVNDTVIVHNTGTGLVTRTIDFS
ncbi:MAG: hypothetical protein RMK00_09550, partial [Bacteroidota bacterium]|nr:hypothetical protein [Bacteroidota bacterium]